MQKRDPLTTPSWGTHPPISVSACTVEENPSAFIVHYITAYILENDLYKRTKYLTK